MARLIALVSFLMFAVFALAGPLDVPSKRSIQHAPLAALAPRKVADTTVTSTKTKTDYVTTVVAATKTVNVSL